MKPRTLCACHCVAVIRAANVAPEGWRNKSRIFSVLVPAPAVRPCFDCLAVTGSATGFEAALRRCGPRLTEVACTAFQSLRMPLVRSVTCVPVWRPEVGSTPPQAALPAIVLPLPPIPRRCGKPRFLLVPPVNKKVSSEILRENGIENLPGFAVPRRPTGSLCHTVPPNCPLRS